MAKKNNDKPYQGIGSKGYSRKIHFKLAKKVHSDFKKKGLKYSWNDAQKFTSLYLFDEYKDDYVSKIDLNEVSAVSNRVSIDQFDNALKIKFRKSKPGQLPPGAGLPAEPEEEIDTCFSVFKIPIEDITAIEWYDIANTLRGLPHNLNVRVNGGPEFGYTEIAHTIEIDYHNDVATIIANIRKYFSNKSGPMWNGEKMIKPGRKDDGKNCSYFIDFILEGDGISIDQDIINRANEPLAAEEEAARLGRLREAERLKNESKAKKEEQRKTREKIDAGKARKRPTSRPEEKEAPKQDIARMLELLQKDFELGVYTKDEYKAERAKLISKLEKGGEL